MLRRKKLTEVPITYSSQKLYSWNAVWTFPSFFFSFFTATFTFSNSSRSPFPSCRSEISAAILLMTVLDGSFFWFTRQVRSSEQGEHACRHAGDWFHFPREAEEGGSPFTLFFSIPGKVRENRESALKVLKVARAPRICIGFLLSWRAIIREFLLWRECQTQMIDSFDFAQRVPAVHFLSQLYETLGRKSNFRSEKCMYVCVCM